MIYGRKNFIIHTNLYQTICLYINEFSLVQLHMFYCKGFVDPYLWHRNQFLVILHHPPLKLADVFAYYALLKRFDEPKQNSTYFLSHCCSSNYFKLFEIFKQTHFIHSSRSGFKHGTLFMWPDPLKMTSHFMINTSLESLSFMYL